MAVTPSGIFSTPLSVLQTMLSNTAAFRTWTGTANPTAALTRIYLIGTTQTVIDAQATSPFALISPGAWSRTMNAGGSRNHLAPGGMLKLIFEADVHVDNQVSSSDAYFEFANNIGLIINEFEDLSGESGNLWITSIATDDNAWRASERKEVADGDRYSVEFDITWGLR